MERRRPAWQGRSVPPAVRRGGRRVAAVSAAPTPAKSGQRAAVVVQRWRWRRPKDRADEMATKADQKKRAQKSNKAKLTTKEKKAKKAAKAAAKRDK